LQPSRLLLAIDPGKATGFAVMDISDLSNPIIISTDELAQYETCRRAEELLSGDIHIEVVMEAFIITPQTGKLNDVNFSLEIIGAVRYFAQKHGAPFSLQKPADAKSFSTNARLKAVGLWHVGGEGHAMDALRHVLLYMVRKHKWRPDNLLEV
jgi:hypothetical protein